MNNGLDILVAAGIDLDKTISQINSDLKALTKRVQSISLNIDTKGMTRDIENHINQVEKKVQSLGKSGGYQNALGFDVNKLRKNNAEVFAEIDKLTKHYNSTVTSMTKRGGISIKEDDIEKLSRINVAMKDLEGTVRKFQMVNTENGIRIDGFDEIHNIEKAQKQAQKLADQQAQSAIKNINNKEKEAEAQRKNTQELDKYIKKQQSLARNQTQELRSVKGNVISPEQNKQIDDYVKNMNNISSSTPNARHQIDNLKQGFSNLRSDIKVATNESSTFMSNLGEAMRRIPIWMIGMSAMYAPLRGLSNAIDTVKMLDSQMVELRRVMDATPATYNRLLRESIDLSTELGNRVADVNTAMVNFSRQGFDPDTLIDLTKTATVASNISSLTPDEAMSSITAAMMNYNIEAEKTMSIIDRVNEIDNNMAIDTKTITEAMERSASTANTFGVELDELLGHISAIGITTRESGRIVGKLVADVKSFLIDLEPLTLMTRAIRAKFKYTLNDLAKGLTII